MEALPQDLADFLVTKNFDPEYFDAQGQPAEAGDAKTMKFDYVAVSGKNYGTAVVVIANNELSLFYGDNLGRGMEPEDKQEWFDFLEQLSNQATSHSATWAPQEINKLKHTLAGIAAIKEGLFEGYYGNRRVSYMGEQTQARLVIQHNRPMSEADKRYRYVESLFIETADQERFRLPFKSLSGGRAMLEHVRSGGRPYDVRGNHISEIIGEMAVLSRFNRAQQRRVYEGVTQELVESARQYYHNLQETMKRLGSSRGYQAYFEAWAPDQTGEAEALVENLRDLFVEQTLDARIEAALPTLAKIQQQGNNMKEAQIFENWVNQLSEGTWALPDTPESQEKLNQLMANELIVGPDATNATELLYDVVGDDELFDILNDLADRSQGRANCWDDSDVQRRLAELGIQTPQSTQAQPANVPQDTAPEVNEDRDHSPVASAITRRIITQHPEVLAKYGPAVVSLEIDDVADFVGDVDEIGSSDVSGWVSQVIRNLGRFAPVPEKRMAEGDNMATFEEQGSFKHHMDRAMAAHNKGDAKEKAHHLDKATAAKHAFKAADYNDRENYQLLDQHRKMIMSKDDELAEMLKYAGVPVSEGVLKDDTGNTWDHLLDRFRHEVENFKQTGDMSDDLFDALYDYYNHHGAMPYGVAKGRSGDPYEWVGDRFAQDIGLDEGWKGALAGGLAGAGLGSVVPGLGTLAGGIAGAYAGHKIGDQGISDPTPDPVVSTAGQAQRRPIQKIDHATRKPYDSGRTKPFQKTVAEGSCNMTMEGEYCPEHGLAECGQASGGVVGMPYSMGEAQAPHDPINSNSAMTGSYYEGKETRTQEGDALLARIKSLALLR
jgi:hypothetical protein